MEIAAEAFILENQRIINRMENAQIRARMETSKIIGRLIRERAGKRPSPIPRSENTVEVREPPPAGLRSIELSQTIKALRSIGERMAASEQTNAPAAIVQTGLRGLAETQDLDLIESKGSLIDRML